MQLFRNNNFILRAAGCAEVPTSAADEILINCVHVNGTEHCVQTNHAVPYMSVNRSRPTPLLFPLTQKDRISMQLSKDRTGLLGTASAATD